MIIASAAILMTAVFCVLACYRVFREEVKENLRICTRLLSDRENIERVSEAMRQSVIELGNLLNEQTDKP